MYTNADLLVLIKESREGGEAEYGRLLGAVHDVLTRGIKSDKCKIARAVATHNSIDDSVSATVIEVTNYLKDRYDPTKGSQPMTYIMGGWNIIAIRDCTSNTRAIKSREDNMNRYRDTLEENQDPFDRISTQEDREHKNELLWEAVRTLPLKQQDVLEGYAKKVKLKDIAETMGVSVQAVQHRQAKAFATLRKILKHKLD